MALHDMSEAELELWIESRFHAELQGLAKFNKEMTEHKELLVASSAEHKEVLELFRNVKAFLRIMKMLERVIVFFTKVGIWCTMMWGLWTFVVKEAIKQVQNGG